MNDDNWDIIREENFPSLKENIHLKAAGGSPLSRPAYEAGIKYFNDMYNHGDIFWEDYFKELSDIKKTIAQYINCRDNEIAFLINTSSCINTISRLFKKCNLIYPEGEFPASVHAFKKRGYNCFKLPKGKDYTYSLDTLENIIKRKEIKIQVHSHIQYLTGFRQDLHELGKICLRNDVLNVINATQSFGAFPIDVKNENIDVLVASGLKWLCCGYGIGILYLKSKHALENELPFTSWLSVKTALDMDNNNIDVINETCSMDGFGGTPNFPALLTLKGGFSLIKRIGKNNLDLGIKRIKKRILNLTALFIDEIRNLGFNIISPNDQKTRSGIVTIKHEGAHKIYSNLLDNHIFISLRNNPNSSNKEFLRFSFNFYNNQNDIQKVIKILKKTNRKE